MLVRKSRLKWLNEGDSNSSFFHKVVRERRRRNHIGPLNTNEGWVEKVEDVREEVTKHFSNKFKEAEVDRMLLGGVSFKSITPDDNIALESPFQEEEIKEAIGCCGSSKSRGPDGYFLLFIKKMLVH